MTTVRETKRADELKEGDWTAPGGISALPAEVLFAVTYPSPVTDNPRTHLVLRESGITLPFSETYAADFPVGIATVQELESTRANADRAQKIADIRALADFLERNPEMPAPSNYDMQLSPGLDFLPELDLWNSGHDGVAEVRRLAGLLGASVVESADRTSATIRVGDAEYRLIAWHKDGRPAEPKPSVDPDASMEAHYDAESDAPHPSWPTEAELKPWETLAPPAGRLAESMEPIDPDSSMEAHYDAETEAMTGLGITDACVITGWAGLCTTHKARHIASGEAKCGCPVYPYAGRGDAADTIVDHRQNCKATS